MMTMVMEVVAMVAAFTEAKYCDWSFTHITSLGHQKGYESLVNPHFGSES